MTEYIILDLDNCIADDGWRIPHIDWSKENLDERYRTYHELSTTDHLRNAVVLNAHRATSPDVEFLIFTARPEEFRDITESWLRRNNIKFRALLMRAPGDERGSVELKQEMLHSLPDEHRIPWAQIRSAYDDRQDVVDMFLRHHIRALVLCIHKQCAYTQPPTTTGVNVNSQPTKPQSAADILDAMAHTFRERNKVYGSNYKMVAPLMKTLFPAGVPPELVVTHKFHLFELVLVKLSRFAISGLSHQDSVHDAGVYCAMVEACILEEQQKGKV